MAESPEELRARADRLESQHCTGATASWCPVHGSCSCPPMDGTDCDGDRTLDDPACPLHAPDSAHAEGALQALGLGRFP